MLACDRLDLTQTQVSGVSLAMWSERCCGFMLRQDAAFDPSHRIDHVRRVFRMTLQLGVAEGAHLAVLVPAAWLHDCLPISKKSKQRERASRLSAEHAVGWLLEQGYEACYFKAIAHAIAAHSFSANIPPDSVEAKVLQDADRLDALGAIGIARCMMLGGQFANQLYHLDDPFPTDRPLDDKHYVIDHFYQKLLKLESSFQTASGRAEAKRRTLYMHDFLKQLKSEIA